jgi:hypothetical protein
VPNHHASALAAAKTIPMSLLDADAEILTLFIKELALPQRTASSRPATVQQHYSTDKENIEAFRYAIQVATPNLAGAKRSLHDDSGDVRKVLGTLYHRTIIFGLLYLAATLLESFARRSLLWQGEFVLLTNLAITHQH